MEQQGMVSSIIASNISVPTWRSNQNESQIDDIWIPARVLQSFSPLSVDSADHVTGSDHDILSTSWKIRIVCNETNKKLKKRTVYQYDKMS